MKNIFNTTIIFIALSLSYSAYAQVYTPSGSQVEYNSFSAGNVATSESQASSWLAARGWTNDVTKTAPATGEYNCHAFAWYLTEGGTTNYWINAFSNLDLSSFNVYSSNSSPPSIPRNIQKYWNDGS